MIKPDLVSLWLISKQASVWSPSTARLLLAIVWYSFFFGADVWGGVHGAGGGGGGGGGGREHSIDIFFYPEEFWTNKVEIS